MDPIDSLVDLMDYSSIYWPVIDVNGKMVYKEPPRLFKNIHGY